MYTKYGKELKIQYVHGQSINYIVKNSNQRFLPDSSVLK